MISKLQGAVILVVVTLMFSMVTLRTEIQQNTQNDLQHMSMLNHEKIKANQVAIANSSVQACLAHNLEAQNVNTIIDALIEGTVAWDAKTREARLKLWKSAKISINPCDQTVIIR